MREPSGKALINSLETGHFCITLFSFGYKSPVAMFRRWHGAKEQHDHELFERQAKINELRDAIGPLSGCSSKFCTETCLIRYLEARNWNLHKSRKMLEETLKWRATYKPEEIRWNTTSQDTQLRHLVYLLENAILNLPPGQEHMVWLIDFNGWSLSNSVPIKTARETANILQNHYPERLAVAFLYNPPKIFEAFWKIVKYFLDPKTSQKVKFVYPKSEESTTLMQEVFDLEKLQATFGGKNDSQYDHEEFSKLMQQDDVKTAEWWTVENRPSQSNGTSTSELDLIANPNVSSAR